MKEAYRQWSSIVAPAGWVRTVAVRIAGDAVKRDQRRIQVEGEYEHQAAWTAPVVPEYAVTLTEQEQAVLARLAGLPAARKRVLALTFDGYKVKEIANELDITEATVRSHLRHLRKAFGPGDKGTGGVA